MTPELPSGFDSLSAIPNRLNAEVSIIGVVTDFLLPSRSRGKDWMCTFSVTGPSLGFNGEQKVRFFRPTEREIPAIQNIGDIVILRKVKVKEWSGMVLLISNAATSWLVFHSDSIPAEPARNNTQIKHIKETRAPTPTPSEMLYAIALHKLQDQSSFSQSTKPSSEPTPTSSAVSVPKAAGPRQKFSLIKDTKIDTYHDLVGQVVKLYPNNDRVELYLTDYTSNTLLYSYEWACDGDDGQEGDGSLGAIVSRSSRKKWRGPYGKMTLTIALWTPHSYFAQSNVKEDDFVHLRNVHIKWSKDSKMEGALHTDKRYPDRIDVTLLKDPQDERVKDILRRKRDYMKKFKIQSEEFIADVRSLKRKQADDGTETLSKSRQRRKRKQQQREQEQEEKNKKQKKSFNSQDGDCDQNETRAPVFPKLELNKHIICSHPLVPSRTLSSILSRDETHAYTTTNGNICTLPFMNISSRTTIRVVDFWPPKLEDFAVRYCVSEFEVLSDDDSTSVISNEMSENASQARDQEVKWEWRFCLYLEDASSISQRPEEKSRLKAFVANQDAQFLLKLDATDLREDAKTLAQLREKLFILWGNLEEKKDGARVLEERDGNLPIENARGDNPKNLRVEEAPRARPFQCCIKEYGVPKHRRDTDDLAGEEKRNGSRTTWERMFAMCGVTIK